MSWIEISFWASLIILFYVFIGYGFVVYLILIARRLFKCKVVNNPIIFEPTITLIIYCFSKTDILATKIANYKLLNYPPDKLKLVCIIDDSTFNSEEILNVWPGIKVLYQPKQEGKAATKNRIMKEVNTPFVVFADVSISLNTDAIKNMVKHFKNESVSCVSGGKGIFFRAAYSVDAAGEVAFRKYDKFLNRLDFEINMAVGASGELVAYRTQLYTNLPEDTILDDFMQSMLMLAAGYKVIYEPFAYVKESPFETVEQELKRKVRMCTGGWQSIVRLYGKLSFFKQPILFFQYISNKALRWTIAPFLLIHLFIINIKMDMYVSGIYQISMGVQFVFYTIAMVGLILKDTNLKYKQIFLPFHFCAMNYAVLSGLVKYLTGPHGVFWDRTKNKVIIFEKV